MKLVWGEHGKLNLYHQGWATGARGTLRDTHDRQYYLSTSQLGKPRPGVINSNLGQHGHGQSLEDSKGISGVCLSHGGHCGKFFVYYIRALFLGNVTHA